MKSIAITVALLAAAAAAPAWAQTAPSSTPATTAEAMEGKMATDTEAATLAASDVRVGARVADKENRKIGKVTAVDDEGVTVDYGKGTTKVPLNSFRKDGTGIVMNITRSDFMSRATNPQ